jgi:acetyltransferase-like isoleucine patch superfamily enzyme
MGGVALLNGYWHKLKFHLLGKRIRIGKWFRVYGKFRIMGAGSVTIGDNCIVQSKLFKSACFLTVFPNAHIEIGDNVGFNGTTIQCFERVTIGHWCSIADAYMIDSKAHHVFADRRRFSAKDVPSAPIVLEDNVWISAKVVVAHGVRIGRNSVVGACSLVRSSIPADSFCAGYPAKYIGPVSSSIDEKE